MDDVMGGKGIRLVCFEGKDQYIVYVYVYVYAL